MRIKKRNLFLLIALFGLASLSGSIFAGNASTTTSTPAVVYGTITNAYYANLNNISYLDIEYDMSFNITDFTATNAVNGYYYTLLVGLTYPDGTTYWAEFNLVTYTSTFGLHVIWYDSVTQGGWYTAQSYTFSTYGNDRAFYSSMEFDPPSAGVYGGSPGA